MQLVFRTALLETRPFKVGWRDYTDNFVIYKACPVCEQRRSKRACPALGRTICAVCCGTKRQTEIDCPPDCSYLSSARAHPAAVVQRRKERDYAFVLPLVQDLTEKQYRLLLALQAVMLEHAATALPSPVDADVRDAASALASTLETAGKGIIYEHQTASVPAQRIAEELRGLLGNIERDHPAPSLQRDAVAALRRIERAATSARTAFQEDGDRAYLALLGRMMSDLAARTTPGPEDGGQVDKTSGLIIPP
jgi:hypothetical protein